MVGPEEGIKFHSRYECIFYVVLFFCTYAQKFWGSSFSSFRGLRVFVLEVFLFGDTRLNSLFSFSLAHAQTKCPSAVGRKMSASIFAARPIRSE